MKIAAIAIANNAILISRNLADFERVPDLAVQDWTKKLKLDVLQRLVDTGNTVIVIEHNLDIIKSADYLIDLGPEGGEGGGKIVAKGTPEEVAKVKKSYTGRALKALLK